MTKELEFTSGSSQQIAFAITSDNRLVVQKEDLWTVWSYLFKGKFINIDWLNKQ